MKNHAAAATLLSVILASCASATPPRPAEKISTDAATGHVHLDDRVKEANAFGVVNDVWLGGTAVRLAEQSKTPALEQYVKLNRDYSQSLHQIGEFITMQTGVAVSVGNDVAEDEGAPAEGQAALPALPTLPGAGVPAGPSVPLMPLPRGSSTTALMINYEGPLRGLLDQVATRMNLGWRFERGAVYFYRIDTRVFEVQILPGTVSIESNITNESTGGRAGSSGGASEGGSTQLQGGMRTSQQLEVNQFDAVEATVKDMLSAKGKVSASPALGQLVVTDTAAVLARVERYIDSVNLSAKRQVVMDVRVYSVESRSSNGYAISWDVVWQSVSRQVGLSLTGAGDSTGGASLGGAVLDDAGAPFAGTQAFLDALATQGDVQQLTSVTSLTMSGRPVPVQVGEEVSYTESSEVTLVPNVGQQVSRRQGKVTSGFSMVLLPFLSSAGDVLMSAQINLSSLRELRAVGDQKDSGYQEMPLIDSRQVAQNVRLASGQTLVLTGFEQDTLRSDARGVGKPGFTLLGGGKKSSRNRSTLVILITPRVVS